MVYLIGMKLYLAAFFGLLLIIAPVAYAEGIIDSGERLRDIQQQRNITIPPEQREAVIAQCAQGKVYIRSVQTSADSAIKKRLITYSEIQKELKAMELRMTRQGADASEIDLLIGKMQQDIDSFSEQARYSAQIVEDIATIDCATSPELYRAAADEYIDTRNEIKESAEQLKTTVLSAPQTTFTPLIDRLRI